MKKVLLALSALGVFALAGCSSDSSESTTTTVENLKVEDLVGTYKIEYFASVAGTIGGASSNWSKLDTYKNVLDETKDMMKPTIAGTVGDAKDNFYGQAVISLDDEKKNFKIVSKLQMKDSSFSNDLLRAQQYNYTEYSLIPVANISGNTLNKSGNTVKGVKGRDMKKSKPEKISENGNESNTYYFTAHNGLIYHYMVDNSVMKGAKVLVVLKKENASTIILDANIQYTNEESGKNDLKLTEFVEQINNAQ